MTSCGITSGSGMRWARGLLTAVSVTVGATAAGAQSRSTTLDDAWADTMRAEAQAAIPVRSDLATDASALFKEGWNPYYAFPAVSIEGGQVREFDWGSSSWRSASLESYLAGKAEWRTMFALSTLNTAEKARFGARPWLNLKCDGATSTRCFIAISETGYDEIRWLEVDGATGKVPEDAFDLKPSRSYVAWLTPDTVLAVGMGPGMRESVPGRSGTVKLWRRGEALDAAATVFQAEPSSGMVSVESYAAGGANLGLIHTHVGTTPRGTLIVGRDDKAHDVGLPIGAVTNGVVDGRLVLTLGEAWRQGRHRWPAGSVLAFTVATLIEGRLPPAETIFRAGGEGHVESSGNSNSVQTTRADVYLAVLRAGTRQIHRASRRGARWTSRPVLAYEGRVAKLIAVDAGGTAALASVESAVEPPSLLRLDGAAPRHIRSARSYFEGRGLMVRRHFAPAPDGTRVPYWLVRKQDVRGALPTIIHAYGASNVPLLPAYAPDVGRLWLQRGGAYVIAQVRGGGEFGPEWSTAGNGLNEGRSVDDLIAVADDLIASGRATPARLGLDGQSSGGQLVSAAAMLRPELFGAVVSRDGAVDPEASAGEAGSPLLAADLQRLSTPEGRAVADAYWPARVFARRRGCPRLLLTSWRGDQRVPAIESRALAARMRGGGCNALLLERIGGEHGVTTGEMLATIYSFFADRLGLNDAAVAKAADDAPPR